MTDKERIDKLQKFSLEVYYLAEKYGLTPPEMDIFLHSAVKARCIMDGNLNSFYELENFIYNIESTRKAKEQFEEIINDN